MDDSFDLFRKRGSHVSANAKRNYFDTDVDLTPKARPAPLQNVVEKLQDAIENHDVSSVTELLLSHVDIVVNKVYPNCSMSLLHTSVDCSDNKPEIVKALLIAGGDPNNTNVQVGLSPLHLSIMLDYDRVLRVLVDHGGDPSVVTPDGQDCYHLAVQCMEEELNDKCFNYFARGSKKFRDSLGSAFYSSSKRKDSIPQDSGTRDEFHTCDSPNSETENDSILHNIPRRLLPAEYEYLMTEDESGINNSDEDESRKKLTTIPEESGLGPSALTSYKLTPSPPVGRGIASMTAPLYLLTDDDSISMMTSGSGPSCVNSTPPITPQPTKAELEKLQEQMKKLNIPVTPSTFNVISKCAKDESRLEMLLTPKVGTRNFSSELQAGIQNLNLIQEWGKHQIDILQNTISKANVSKSFYNYLLVDPKLIKRTNFSGDHLKTGVISSSEKFETFLHSVFYIGKAHGKRPLQHLVEAKTKFNELGKAKCLKLGEKVDRILKIWASGMGVIIVSVFHHSSEQEAYMNEACMIDAIGLGELSNIKKGNKSNIPQKSAKQLGSLLLYKSFCTFVVGDPKQFYPQDF